jgi:steroid 5-alpha reductase family enzyme
MMIEMITASPFLMGAATIVVMLTCVWVASLVLRDAGIIDMFWGLGYALIALTTLLSSENLSPLAVATGLAVMAWGVRLFTHLLIRWRKEPEEDYRYQNMRKKHGDHFWWRSIFTVFLFQGLLMWLVSMPFMAAFYFAGPAALPGLTIVFLVVALGGLYMETMADIQLTQFRATAKKGELLDSGWWKRTRHPNYFGDALFWWGIYGAVVAATPEAIWTIFAPLTMNYLLVKVSGADLLEYRLKKKPGYTDYMQRTNRFVPKIFG